MPADYMSTARALSLPTSPIDADASLHPDDVRPAWRRSRSESQPQNLRRRAQTLVQQLLQHHSMARKKVRELWAVMTPLQRVLAVVAAVVLGVVGLVVVIWHKQIFAMLAPVAQSWRELPGGWLILFVLITVCAFPPIIGYSTAVTLTGFVYGFPNGWLVAASANVFGSALSFLACRTILSQYVHKLVGEDKRFKALGLTLKHDGLKVLCMVRLCPLPYSISNGALATFPTLDVVNFALATALASPKLLIHVFIGSRLASLAEGGGEKDTTMEIVNYISIFIGGALGVAMGWFIYQRTMARAKELEAEEIAALRAQGELPGPDGFEDDDRDGAALMNEDDISLWENEDRDDSYFDEPWDGPGAAHDEEALVGTRPGDAKR